MKTFCNFKMLASYVIIPFASHLAQADGSQWKIPDHGFSVSASASNSIQQRSGETAKLSGNIDLIGIRLKGHSSNEHDGGDFHWRGDTHHADESDVESILELLKKEDVQIRAFFPDYTTEVSSSVTFKPVGNGLEFQYQTPVLKRDDVNVFTVQVVHYSPNSEALQRVQSKLERRVTDLTARISRISAGGASAADIAALQAVRANLQAIISKIAAKLQARVETLAEMRLPLQVDNIIAGPSFSSTVMNKFRFSISYGIGTAIEGEKTKVSSTIMNLRKPDEASIGDEDVSSEDLWVAQFLWKGKLVKQLAPRAILNGTSIGFEFQTEKLLPESQNSFYTALYSWDHELGKRFGHLAFELPVAADSLAPTWAIASATPDQIHTCSQNMQAIDLMVTDLFGLIDPSRFSANLVGSLPDGSPLNNDVTSKLSVAPMGQTSSYTPGSQSYSITGNLNTLPEGRYTFNIHGQDLAENGALPDPYAPVFRINRTPPVIQLTVSDSIYTNKPYTNKPNMSFGATILDYFDLCSIRSIVRNNGTVIAQTDTASLLVETRLSEGLNLLEVNSSNLSDGLSAETKGFQIILDTIPAVISNLKPVNNGIVSTLSVPVSGQANEPLSYAKVNGVPLALSEDKKTFSGVVPATSEGTLTLNWEVADLAGNITAQSTSVQIILKVLNGDLISTYPDADGVHVVIQGAQWAARPNITVSADAGFFNAAKAVSGPDGSFLIRLAMFSQATLSASYNGRTDTVTVNFVQGSGTLLSGAVKDTQGNALPGIKVTFLGLNIDPAYTDASGVFKFTTPVTGDQKLVIDGTALVRFSRLLVTVNVGFGQQNVLPTPIYLAPLEETATPYPNNGTEVTVTGPADTSLVIPAGQDVVTFPDGISHTGKISISKVDAKFATVPTPSIAQPDSVLALEPSGVRFSKPVKLTVPNENNLPAGVDCVVFSMNSATGRWELNGAARVSADGQTIQTKEDQGITHFSMVYVAPVGPVVLPIGENTTAQSSAFDGSLTRTIDLPAYNLLGKLNAPSLMYKSSWARPTALVSNFFDIPKQEVMTSYNRTGGAVDDAAYTHNFCHSDVNNLWGVLGDGCVPTTKAYYVDDIFESSYYQPKSIVATFYGPGIKGDPLVFDGTNLPRKAVLSYAMELKDKETQQYFPTGVYPYISEYEVHLAHMVLRTVSRQVYGNYHSPQTDKLDTWSLPAKLISSTPEEKGSPVVYSKDVAGDIVLQNETASPYGRGWKISNIQKIINPNDNRVFIDDGDGGTSTYGINDVITTLFDAGAAGVDLRMGVDISHWPTAYGIQTSGSKYASSVVRIGPSGVVGTIGNIFPVDGALRAFEYWNMQDFDGSDNSSNCNQVEYQYSIGSRPQQLLALPDGRVIGTDENRSILFQASAGSTSILAGALAGPYSDVSPELWSPAFYCKFDDGVCKDSFGHVQMVGATFNNVLNPVLSGDCDFINQSLGACSRSYLRQWNDKSGYGRCGAFLRNDGNTVNPGFNGDGSLSAQINHPAGLTLGPNNTIVFADYGNNRVRKIDLASGTISTIAGSGANTPRGGGAGGDPRAAVIYNPRGVTYDSLGNLYISASDGFGNGMIWKVDPTERLATIFAGWYGTGDSTTADVADVSKVILANPYGMVVDSVNRYLYVAEESGGIVRRIDLDGDSRKAVVVAGARGGNGSYADGVSALNAGLADPTSLALDADGNLIIVDAGSSVQKIRKVIFNNTGSATLTFLPARRDNTSLTKTPDELWIRRYRNGTQVKFDETGREISRTDAVGNVRAIVYDVAGRIDHITEPLNKVTQFSYSGGQVSITTPGNLPTVLKLSSSGSLAEVEFPDQAKRNYTYTSDGLLRTETNYREQPLSTNFKYTDWGRLTEIEHPDGSKRKFMDAFSQTVANQATISNFEETGAQGQLSSFGSGEQQIAQVEIDESNNVTKTVLDFRGSVSSVVDPKGNVTRFRRNLDGLETQVRREDSNGNILFDKVITRIDSSGDIRKEEEKISQTGTSYRYDYDTGTGNFGNLVSVTDPRNNVVSYAYYGNGLLHTSTRPLEDTVNYIYNSSGQVTSIQKGSRQAQVFTINGTTGYADTVLDSSGVLTTYTYSNSGAVRSIQNANGTETRYEYDGLNRPTAVTVGFNTEKARRTEFQYWPTGDLKQIKDSGGNVRNFDYKTAQRQYLATDSYQKIVQRDYNADGTLLSMTYPNGDRVSFEYNELKQPLRKYLYKGGTLKETVSFAYDSNGNLTLAKNAVSQADMQYDGLSRLISASTKGLDSSLNLPSLSLTYINDENGNRASVTDLSGAVSLTYTHDVDDRLATLRGSSGEQFVFDYDGASRLTKVTRKGSTSQINYSYSDRPFIASIVSSGSSDLPKYSYPVRDQLRQTKGVTIGFGAAEFSRSIEYDPLTEVSSVTSSGDVPLSYQSEGFQYDVLGNVILRNGVAVTYDEKKLRLAGDGFFTYEYDENGNVITRQSLADPQNYENFSYSAEQKLTGIKYFARGQQTPIKEISYVYDALGRRIQKKVIDYASLSDPEKTFTRSYAYDGSNVLIEYDGNGVTLAQYTHSGLADDDVLAVNVKPAGVPALAKNLGTYFYLKDESGNVTDVVDDSGNEVQHYVYSAFGERLRVLNKPNGQDMAPVLKTSYGFSGRESDEESGLYYFRNRYYDPRIGRFLQEDPEKSSVAKTGNGLLNDGASAGLPAALDGNGYYYAWNNPVRFNDPFGLWVASIGFGFDFGVRSLFLSYSGTSISLASGGYPGFGVTYSNSLAFDSSSMAFYIVKQTGNYTQGSGFLASVGYSGGIFFGNIEDLKGAGSQFLIGGGNGIQGFTATFGESSGIPGTSVGYLGRARPSMTLGLGAFRGPTNTTVTPISSWWTGLWK